MRSIVTSHQKLMTTKSIIEADPLITTWEVAEELNVGHSTVVLHWKQIGKVKQLDNWVPHELTKNQKIILKCCLFLLHETTINYFFIELSCVTKSVTKKIHNNWWWPAQRLDQEAPKHFPKTIWHQKKGMVTIWWSAAHMIYYSFLSPSEIITSERYAQQINEMHQKLQCLHLALVNRKGPTLLWQHQTPRCITNASKVERIGLQSLASSTVFTWPLANWLPFFSSISITFCRENASTTRRTQKALSKNSSNPKTWIFILHE